MGRRDLTLLAAGQLISVAGDSAALVALLLRLRPEGSGWVAALLAAELVPYIICAPVSGRVVDRFETHRVLLLALIGQAVVAVPLALVNPAAATVALFFVLNAVSTLVRPATSTLVPVIVGADDAPRGYSRLATGTSLGWIVGPAIGGLLTGTIGVRATLLIDAATFAVLTVAVAFIRARRQPGRGSAAADDRAGEANDHRGGLALVWHSPVLRIAVFGSAIASGCAVVDNVAAPFRFINQLHSTQFDYGLYLTLWGIGALLGVQILPRLKPAQHPAALAAGNLVMGISIAGIGLAPNLGVALVASGVGGIGNGLVNVVQSALVAEHTPSEQHGRAFAATSAITQSAIGIGTAAAAPLVAGLGAGRAMAAAGGLAALAALVGLSLSRPHQHRPELTAKAAS